jgi:UDP-N-acetylmuramoylalanine--D-glutamate ligase
VGPDRPGLSQNGVGLRREAGRTETLLPSRLAVPGEHNRLNLLAAGLGARLFGLEPEPIAAALGSFAGIEHRLELVAAREGVRIYNDSAATIPEATAAALESLPAPVFLIAGGTDKNLEFRPLAGAAGRAAGIYLLAGSATRTIEALFRAENIAFEGPFPAGRRWAGPGRRPAAGPRGPGPRGPLLFSPGLLRAVPERVRPRSEVQGTGRRASWCRMRQYSSLKLHAGQLHASGAQTLSACSAVTLKYS